MSKPEETSVERYILKDGYGNTVYAYWKIVYEELTEEFLHDSYEIKNVQLSKKGQPRKSSMGQESNDSDSDFNKPPYLRRKRVTQVASTTNAREWTKVMDPIKDKEWTQKVAAAVATNKEEDKHQDEKSKIAIKPKKGTVSFTAFSQYIVSHNDERVKLCLDEMDLAGTVYKKTTHRARRKSGYRDYQISVTAPITKHSIFVPIAICIKTTNPYSEQADQLLDSLITTLYKKEGSYVCELHNVIFAFAEFCTHVLTLTHITTPPPFTELIVPMCNKEITYYEALISNLPCEGDISIAQLFSLLYTDYIITLWTALLTEKPVVIYTNNPNIYFYIAKPLMHLMFPLDWPYIKGILPTLDLLASPHAFFAGVLKTSFPNKDELIEVLSEQDTGYLLLDIDSEGKQTLQIALSEALIYPRDFRLKQELDACCSKYGISRKGIITKKEARHVEFAKQIQEIFFNEVAGLIKGFDQALKTYKGDNVEIFKQEFFKIYSATGIKPSRKDEATFVQNLVEKQSFASLYDEAKMEMQGNFARVEAMNVRGKSPPIELLRIILCSNPQIVLTRLNKLVELAKQGKNEENKNANNEIKSEIPLKGKLDWIKEINRMKMTGAIIERSGEFRSSIIKHSNSRGIRQSRCSFGYPRSSSSDSSGSSPKRAKREPIAEEIVMSVEELKEVNPYRFTVLQCIEGENQDKKPSEIVKESMKKLKRGTLFYGRKGALAFLDEFMSFSQDSIKKLGIIQEEKGILENLKNSVTYARTSSGGSRGNSKEGHMNMSIMPGSQIPEKENDSDSAYSEGSDNRSSPGQIVSELVTSLVDMKDYSRINSFLKGDVQFIYFTSTNCLQFHLFMAFFYSKYDTDPNNAIKSFNEAFKYLQTFKTYSSYFPINYFKSLIYKLQLDEVRKQLASPGELSTVIKAIYDKKVEEEKRSRKSAIMSEQPSKKSSRHPDPSSAPSPPKRQGIDKPETDKLRKQLDKEFSSSIISDSSDKQTPYINNYKKLFKTTDPNPNTIIACALKDLILLLNVHKGKGQGMFEKTGKSPHFEVVDKQAAVLRPKHLFEKDKKLPPEPSNQWLQGAAKNLAFFLNLHNFMILFALCKTPPSKFPKTMQDWALFSKSVIFRVGPYQFTAFEIQHTIIRAYMHLPKFITSHKELLAAMPQYSSSDFRNQFKFCKNEPLLNFGFYLPCKSSPPLRIYTPDNILAQLALNARDSLLSAKISGSKGTLKLPGIMEFYEEDFYGQGGKEEAILFVKKYLPSDISAKHSKLFSQWYFY